MSSDLLAFLELFLVLGVVLGFAVLELVALRRSKDDTKRPADQGPGG